VAAQLYFLAVFLTFFNALRSNVGMSSRFGRLV
jgi:hypothetical protein